MSEHTPTILGTRPHSGRVQAPSWYRAYFFLALFDVLTVAGGLYLNYSIMTLFTGSVRVNSELAAQIGDVAVLRGLAGEVNAPGNDVFDSHDVSKESARMQDALAIYQSHAVKLQEFFGTQVRDDDWRSLTEDLAAIENSMQAMLQEERQIFDYFATAQPAKAGSRMATMDRKFADVNRAISQLENHLREQQHAHLKIQQRTAVQFQKFEYLVAGMIVVMIVCATWYARRVHRAMTDAAREREQFSRELADTRDAALDASRAKSEFLANMSHEIRTPMNGVLGMAELLLKTPLNNKQRRFAETINRSGQKLLCVINDILDFSKIEAGKLELQCQSFDLRQLVEDTLDLYAARAHAKSLELACAFPANLPTVYFGDDVRLRQILTNLLGNAIKFTECGEVVVRVSSAATDAESTQMRLEIIDSGIGIEPAAQAHVFESFAQADSSTTRKYGGTGLGLSISKRLVELMGGNIGVDSEIGRGSTFWITLPLQHAEAEPTPVAKAAHAKLQSLRALVVDDNATNREILDHQLCAWGVEHALTGCGATALDLLRTASIAKKPYGLVIVDYQMPHMDGIELARRIKSEPSIAGARIVMLSSVGNFSEPDLLNAAGIEAYLDKPVRQSTLYDCLIKIFNAPHPGCTAQVDPHESNGPAMDRNMEGRVLLAEDDEVNQLVAAVMLSALGVEATIVGNGRLAIDAVTHAQQPFDLILMDMQMPQMDGLAATQEIRQRGLRGANGAPITIIALTANTLARDQERCLAAGMNDYLSKPFSQEELRVVLEHWLPVSAPTKRLPDSLDTVSSALDPAGLHAIRALQPALVARLLAMYLDLVPRLVGDIDAGLVLGDHDRVGRAAADICTASASLGAFELAQRCKDLCTQVVTGMDGNAKHTFATIKLIHDQVRTELKLALDNELRANASPLKATITAQAA